MDYTISKVKEFMETVNQDVPEIPTVPSLDTMTLRLNMNLEELSELSVACGQAATIRFIGLLKNKISELTKNVDKIPEETDMVEAFDAMIDKRYIADGDVCAFGFQDLFTEGFDEVQGSNMSKLGADGKPIYREDGKVLKGPNFYKPDLKKILEKNK